VTSRRPALEGRPPPSRRYHHGFARCTVRAFACNSTQLLAQGGIGACERPVREKGFDRLRDNQSAQVLNALNTPTWTDLRTAFEDAKADASVHGVILTGAGDKAFIAGADISELAHVDAYEAEESSRFGQGVLDLVENLGKPVIAAINGFALGGGCETAMACTMRIAAEHARFGQPEVKLGLLPGGGGTQRLPRLVGKGRALQLILTGETISAQEAYRIGLVNEVVPAAGLIDRAETILKQISANAPIAVKFSLEAANKGLETSQSEGLALEASYFGICAATEDKKEGTSAFLEKRAPKFRGR